MVLGSFVQRFARFHCLGAVFRLLQISFYLFSVTLVICGPVQHSPQNFADESI